MLYFCSCLFLGSGLFIILFKSAQAKRFLFVLLPILHSYAMAMSSTHKACRMLLSRLSCWVQYRVRSTLTVLRTVYVRTENTRSVGQNQHLSTLQPISRILSINARCCGWRRADKVRTAVPKKYQHGYIARARHARMPATSSYRIPGSICWYGTSTTYSTGYLGQSSCENRDASR